MLRLRALIPGEDVEVLSACFHALLAIDLRGNTPFVSRFLSSSAESAGEAAFALAETHSEMALDELLKACQTAMPKNSENLPALLQAVALTRLPRSVSYLLSLVEAEERCAPEAIQAVVQFNPGAEIRSQLEAAVETTGSPRLRKVLAEELARQ